MNITEILAEIEAKGNSAFLYTPPLYKEECCIAAFNPEEIIRINSSGEYNRIFSRFEELRKEYFIIPILEYEAGYLFEKKLHKFLDNKRGGDLITLLLYDRRNVRRFNTVDIKLPDDLNEIPGYTIDNFRFNTDYQEYLSAIARIKKHIYDGDTYQVNYTMKSRFTLTGSPASLFINLINNQSTKYSAYINLGGRLVLSISPELFFEINGSKITTRPMKGTIRRGINLDEDAELAQKLSNSEKDRAENVMIVDLLRNDFGRISEFGSVNVLSLFDIEKYESVFQMTSAIEANLRDISFKEILENVFPCGSITGAPKIRTMEIIKELEKEERGIYTGSIGFVDGNKAVLNVAIRTIVLDNKSFEGEMGLGGGIVWDSCAGKEYAEAELKGKFLMKQDKQFRLIETMLLEKGDYFLIDEHLKRLEKSAGYFLFNFDGKMLLEKLTKLKSELSAGKNYKIRVQLIKSGAMEFSHSEFNDSSQPIRVRISSNKVNSRNKFQYFKTTERGLYNFELKEGIEKGFFDTLYLNEKDELTEGAITNLFIYKKGEWYTPDVKSGLLAGCYRDYFIRNRGAREISMQISELTDAERVILVNSVRKELPVSEIWHNGEIIWLYMGC